MNSLKPLTDCQVSSEILNRTPRLTDQPWTTEELLSEAGML
jgi:hypothetical protein